MYIFGIDAGSHIAVIRKFNSFKAAETYYNGYVGKLCGEADPHVICTKDGKILKTAI